jgi:ribonuclease Z
MIVRYRTVLLAFWSVWLILLRTYDRSQNGFASLVYDIIFYPVVAIYSHLTFFPANDDGDTHTAFITHGTFTMIIRYTMARRLRLVTLAHRQARSSFHTGPAVSAFQSVDPHISLRKGDPKSLWHIHSDMNEHIRASISTIDAEEKQIDTGFAVTFLGTGAGQTSILRGNSATALRMGSNTYLFDAGEGLQRQLMLSTLNTGDIRKIFITHMHGDHILGLPGLLMGMQLIAKMSKKKKKSLKIYGPSGLYNYISVVLSLTFTELNYLSIEVYELTGGSRRWQHPGASKQFKEFNHRNLQHKTIPMNPDGTWTIEEADEVDTPEEAVRFNSRARGVYIQAAELQHVPKLQCFGYVVKETAPPRSLDVNRATELGVQPGGKYKLLKGGFPVMSDDGTREVKPDDVLTGEAPKPRKFALLGDCVAIPQPMTDLCRDADVLVHEATLNANDSQQKIQLGGHSTPQMAGSFADYVKAEVLALSHISPSPRGQTHKEVTRSIVSNAKKVIRGGTRVQLSYDLMEIVVPRGGFSFQQKTKVETEQVDSVEESRDTERSTAKSEASLSSIIKQGLL